MTNLETLSVYNSFLLSGLLYIFFMSQKSEKSIHDALFDGIETKLLVFGSKP